MLFVFFMLLMQYCDICYFSLPWVLYVGRLILFPFLIIIVGGVPERREHKELVSIVRSRPSPSLIHCNASTHISSQHKRKLRSLSICPVNEQLFITRY